MRQGAATTSTVDAVRECRDAACAGTAVLGVDPRQGCDTTKTRLLPIIDAL